MAVNTNPGNFRGLLDALRDPSNSQGLLDMGLSLMGASGPSPVPMGFGQRVASAAMNSRQVAAQRALEQMDLRQMETHRRLAEAQIAKMQRPEQAQSPFANIDPSRYTPASVARFQMSRNYGELEPLQKVGGEDGPFGKVNPGDYSPGSLAKFARSGSYADLERSWAPHSDRIVMIGGVPNAVPAVGGGAPRPLSTPGAERGADAAKAEATAVGAAAGDRAAKAPAIASLDYAATQMQDAVNKTTHGGFMGVAGKVGGVTDYQAAARFDNVKEQLSTELRTVFRIPGEGTLSDREQAQYGVQLPDRKYSRTTNEKILKDLTTRARLRVSGPGDMQIYPGAPDPAANVDDLLNKYAPRKTK